MTATTISRRNSFERRTLPEALVRTHANALVRLKERMRLENEPGLHVGSYVSYRNVAAERPERLLLFGSSFSDHRAECSLLTFVAALFFREVHFVWSSSLDTEFIRRIEPDLAICEMPERFLGACPSDDFDLAAHELRVGLDWESRLAATTRRVEGNPSSPQGVADPTWTRTHTTP